MLAFLTIKDVVIGTAEVLDHFQVDGQKPGAEVLRRLSASGDKIREMHLKFTKEGESWKLLVPETAIARYAKQLSGGAGP